MITLDHPLLRAIPIAIVALACSRKPDEPVAIYLERSSCFGHCPTYYLILTRSGSASRHGVQWTSFIGHYQATFDSKLFAGLARFVTTAGFESLDTAYVTTVTDMATTTTCLHWTTHLRCIRHYGFDGPPALYTIENAIDTVASHLDWSFVSP